MLKSIAVCFVEILSLSVSLQGLGAICLHRKFWRPGLAQLATLSAAPLLYLIIFSASALPPEARILPLLAGILLTLAVALDLTARLHFDQTAVEVFRHLPVKPGGGMTLKMLRAYLRQYVPPYYLLPIPGAAVLAGIMLRPAARPPAIAVLIAACLFEVAAMAYGRRKKSPAGALSGLEQAFVDLGKAEPPQPLYTAPRMQNIRMAGPPLYKPRTILLIINESAGRHLPASSGHGSLADKLRHLSGDAGAWFVPANAVTNSTCTDVSLPSILTGCGAHESIETLHSLPFVFDLAKCLGYTTQFYTSSVMEWCNLAAFLRGAALDTLFSADTLGLPFVNDLAVDDLAVVSAWRERLASCGGDLFSVLYTNALHLPFQTESAANFPSGCTSRRDRALFITETAHQEMFDALKAAGRYDDALIFTIGDHGETEYRDVLTQGSASRLIKFSREVLHPLFMIKPPKALPAHLAKALFANRNALITNADIAPTLAALFGLGCEGLDYTGHSLLSPIPADRCSFVLTTNAWRSWPRNAAAVIRGNTQLIIDNTDDRLCWMTGPKADKNELLAQALRHPVLGKAIGATFVEKLKDGAAPA